ncbi:hypothetical protein KIN20_023321 [Parelaphostrongylus tenuis]|uniref:Uncharacterized protein n=1 Tax=Parelaphostrongylus tenuis TaxID=148309 RepID=A0AAD5QVY7_PARTN|nr:hypothetical protein KIN20_023321 [Parelaphostrongylus tenuis]
MFLQRYKSSHYQVLKEYKLRSGQTDFTHLDDIQIKVLYTEIMSDASDKASDRNFPLACVDPQPAASSITAANSVIPHDNSLLSFVDASIFSKLRLPSFDGNPLDYLEFSVRFATLVDNEKQLDDTTKFSLLKSESSFFDAGTCHHFR